MKKIIFGLGLGFIVGVYFNEIWYNKFKINILIPIDNLPIDSGPIDYINTYNTGIVNLIKDIK